MRFEGITTTYLFEYNNSLRDNTTWPYTHFVVYRKSTERWCAKQFIAITKHLTRCEISAYQIFYSFRVHFVLTVYCLLLTVIVNNWCVKFPSLELLGPIYILLRVPKSENSRQIIINEKSRARRRISSISTVIKEIFSTCKYREKLKL